MLRVTDDPQVLHWLEEAFIRAVRTGWSNDAGQKKTHGEAIALAEVDGPAPTLAIVDTLHFDRRGALAG